VLQVVVVDPPEAFFQVMVLDALKALVNPEYDADGDDKDEDKDDEAELGCRGAPSRTRCQPKTRGLESIEYTVLALCCCFQGAGQSTVLS